MTKELLEKANYLQSIIDGVQKDFKEIKRIYNLNKTKKLSDDDIQTLIKLASDGNEFILNSYKAQFEKL